MVKRPTFISTALRHCGGNAFRCTIAFIIAWPAAASSLCAQATLPDTVYSIKNVSETYLQTVGSSAAIFNGPEYTRAYPSTTGTPFFLTDQFMSGMVSFKGIHSSGV